MMTVLLVIHLMVASALVGVVLLQRSEGGALGIGGGGGSGGFLTGRGQANLLTRVTAGLALAFFTTSILLTIVGNRTEPGRSVFDAPAATTSAPATDGSAPAAGGEAPASPSAPATDGGSGEAPSGGILDKLR